MVELKQQCAVLRTESNFWEFLVIINNDTGPGTIYIVFFMTQSTVRDKPVTLIPLVLRSVY